MKNPSLNLGVQKHLAAINKRFAVRRDVILPEPLEPRVAGKKLRQAVRRGRISRPTKCEVCSACPPQLKGNIPGIQAHHPDYRRPYVVQWLCVQCHRDVTPIPEDMAPPTAYGEQHPNAKLTWKLVAEIRKSSLSNGRLAQEYGVDKTTIRDVRNMRRWKPENAPLPAPPKSAP